ncbi:ParB/RepB/Spo0J family partition protein [Streptomyces sp. NBC_00237]|uniref:ParB/RepB/Spo0J family partition protein n=1 Tax=Streptomyces sp. NBC_00237 TaxID=2975687 RepID=UPI0022552B3E|nr:ParB/RepB/Spo0J family partition protein [Streptomyces sp. NBC_00237]MCX5206519.1 ParB/RepB/Spo0J family partition protein [Streptomyces sp. NBC_00237]
MSVADRLGTGSSFGGVPRGRSARGRAKALVQGDVPEYELSRIRLEEVAPTPLNPRRNFGSEEEMTRFGEELRNTQLAACVAISRKAYLKIWPQHELAIGDAQYVLINGERRYRSASHVGLESLDFVVRDDLASSREAFIDHLLKENLEREDFDVVERARGVQQLVLVCSEESASGARARAAKRLGRDRSWVTNQLALLDLPEDLQGMLSTGSLPERDGRLLARRLKEEPGLDVPSLLQYLRQYRDEEARTREEAKAIADQIKQQGRSATEEAFARKSAELVAEKAEAERALSADNMPQPVWENPPAPRAPEPAAPVAAEASAPTPAPAPTPASAPAPAAAPAPTPVPVRAVEEQPAEVPELLSADNNSARLVAQKDNPAELADGSESDGDADDDVSGAVEAGSGSARSEAARRLVQQLGATSKEQARTLAAGLSGDELVALIEELHQHM